MGVRCLGYRQDLVIEVGGDSSDLPLHECDPNFGVRR